MRLNYILAISCFIFSACYSTSENKSKLINNTKALEKSTEKKFFEYDSIDYYSNPIDESKVDELYDNQSKSEIDSFKMGIILGYIPNNIKDLTFIDKLEKVGYKKTRIDKSKFDSIDKIFIERVTKENLATSCIYVYRDILIFKKDEKVIGTAKICFDCMANQIKGTMAETENFGQDGDYAKLEKLLRQ